MVDSLGGRRGPPRSLAGLKDWRESDLARIADIGGTVELPGRPAIGPRLLRQLNLSLDELLPSLSEFSSSGEEWAARHWPWAAVACSRWRFQSEAFARRGPISLTPTEVKSSLARISNYAGKMLKEISALDGASHSLFEHESNKSGHISWLLHYLFLFQDFDVRLYDFKTMEVTDELALQMLKSRDNLYERLVRLEASARALGDVANPELLALSNPARDPGLVGFVRLVSEIWVSLTGRVSSVNKLPGREDERPDFVRFVQGLANVQILASAGPRPWAFREEQPFDMVAPTYAAIETAFKRTVSGAQE
jgi:hypothetical protein